MNSKKAAKDSAYDRLIIDEAVYRTRLNKMHRNRKPYQPDNPKKITSFMPGNIQEVCVQTGDKVEAGMKLCILDAMKMKNVIVSPMAGTVKSVNVSTGSQVPKNYLLVELK